MPSTLDELHYTIAPEVFERFPGYTRGVVIARDMSNGEPPDECVALLRDAEASLRSRLDIQNIAQHPRMESWRNAFRSFGARPSEFRSSIEAMARRVLRGHALPSINVLVDTGNIVSLRHLLPVGCHAIDVLTLDIELREATGEEDFVALGSEDVEHPAPGEIIFVEGNTVLTRRWTWRQAWHTATSLSSRDVEFNVDGLPPVTPSEVESICKEVIGLLERFCGGRTRYEVLTQQNPRIKLTG